LKNNIEENVMKNIKIYLTAILSAVMLLTGSVVKAEGEKPSNASELRVQIFAELKDALSGPITLNFTDKNLNGEAYVTVIVEKNGKIDLKGVTGENNVLNSMLELRMNEKNLWTDTKFAGNEFTFKVCCKGICKMKKV
jgi:hypothetical protein